MKIIRWTAVGVTALFVLMNAGAVVDPSQPTWVRVFGAGLGLAGIVAGVGLCLNKPWGWAAVVVVGACNCLGAFGTLLFGGDGFVLGIVAGGLAVLLGVLARPAVQQPAGDTPLSRR